MVCDPLKHHRRFPSNLLSWLKLFTISQKKTHIIKKYGQSTFLELNFVFSLLSCPMNHLPTPQIHLVT